MKVRVIQADKTLKTCIKCGFDGFRKSTKSKNIDDRNGITYELMICDSCGHREQYNEIKWCLA